VRRQFPLGGNLIWRPMVNVNKSLILTSIRGATVRGEYVGDTDALRQEHILTRAARDSRGLVTAPGPAMARPGPEPGSNNNKSLPKEALLIPSSL
jgi:hypothetical protein